MCAHELIVCLREYQVADLGTSVYAVQRCQVQGVPETDALIGSTTARGKEASVQWAPVDGFYCCLMIRKPLERPIAGGRPYEELVVVTAWCQLVLIVEAPSQAANFLAMLSESHVAIGACPQVSDQNGLVFAAGRDDRGSDVVPCQGADSLDVTIKRPDFSSAVDVPNLDLAILGAHAQVTTTLRPTQRSDLIVFPNIAKLLHSRSGSVPHVHRRLKGNSQYILGGPVHKIEVKVILQARCIQNPEWVRRDLPWLRLLTDSRRWSVDEHLLRIDEPIIKVVFKSLLLDLLGEWLRLKVSKLQDFRPKQALLVNGLTRMYLVCILTLSIIITVLSILLVLAFIELVLRNSIVLVRQIGHQYIWSCCSINNLWQWLVLFNEQLLF